MNNATRVRELNDTFRRSLVGGRILLSVRVNALPYATKARLIGKVRMFDGFNLSNDPTGEHVISTVEDQGIRYLAVIDYFTPNLCRVSNDPSDPTKTTRVLTIMRADEY